MACHDQIILLRGALVRILGQLLEMDFALVFKQGSNEYWALRYKGEFFLVVAYTDKEKGGMSMEIIARFTCAYNLAEYLVTTKNCSPCHITSREKAPLKEG